MADYGFGTFFDRNIFSFSAKRNTAYMSLSKAWVRTYLDPPETVLKQAGLGGQDTFADRQTRRAVLVNYTSGLAVFTNFIGLPFFGYKKSPFEQISHWDDKDSLGFNRARAAVFITVNIVLWPFRLLLNIAKFVTEFLPLGIKQVTGSWINQLRDVLSDANKDYSIVAKIGAAAALIPLIPIHFAAKLVHLVGRATTAPGESIRAAFKAGEELGGDGPLGSIIGGAFAAVSIALTTAVFVIAWPIAAKVLPTAVTTPVLNFLSPVLGPINSFLGPIVAPVFNALGGFFAGLGSSAAIGLGAIAGVVAGPVAIAIDQQNSTTWFQDLIQDLKKAVFGEPDAGYYTSFDSEDDSEKEQKEKIENEINPNPDHPSTEDPNFASGSSFVKEKDKPLPSVEQDLNSTPSSPLLITKVLTEGQSTTHSNLATTNSTSYTAPNSRGALDSDENDQYEGFDEKIQPTLIQSPQPNQQPLVTTGLTQGGKGDDT